MSDPLDMAADRKSRTVTGIKNYVDPDTLKRGFKEMAWGIILKAFKDESTKKKQEILEEVCDDFAKGIKEGRVKHPGATFRLAIMAAANGKCQVCGFGRLHMYTSDAGEKICSTCVGNLEDEINFGLRKPKEPDGGTDWLKEKTT